ncbi:unnamed protein product, partial [Prorocentrum cordatum]
MLGLLDSLGPAILLLGLLGGGLVLALAVSSPGDGHRGLDHQNVFGDARALFDLAEQRAHRAQLEGVTLRDLLAAHDRALLGELGAPRCPASLVYTCASQSTLAGLWNLQSCSSVICGTRGFLRKSLGPFSKESIVP